MITERKTENLHLRLTPNEKKNISYHAQLMNMSVNEYISLCIRRKRIVICENFPQLLYHLSKIGNNINQIAAAANTTKYISQSDVQTVISEMKEVYQLLNDFISFITEPENDYLKNDSAKTSELLGEIVTTLQSMNGRMLKMENRLDELE